MNKKIASEIAIGIILLVAIIYGGYFWLQDKQQYESDLRQLPSVTVAEETGQSIEEVTEANQFEAYNDMCKKYAVELSKLGEINYGNVVAADFVENSSGVLCSVTGVKQMLSSENINTEEIRAVLQKDGWQEDLTMKRDMGGLDGYSDISGYKQGNNLLIFKIATRRDRAEVDKCIENGYDAKLKVDNSSQCIGKIKEIVSIIIMAGKGL